jgi:DNA-binding HxlR family transcriptional regulator
MKESQMNEETVCNAECPVQKTSQVIEGKWTTLIVRDLLSGKKRYSELHKSLGGISPKLLAARLRMLEANGLIKRTVYPTVPVTTEYELTELGQELHKVIQAMAEFGAMLN